MVVPLAALKAFQTAVQLVLSLVVHSVVVKVAATAVHSAAD